MKSVAIIGSGPAGLMSAFLLSKKNISCVLFEKDKEIGKRLKVSGNGRCNLFHHPMDYTHYSNPFLAKKYMEDFMKNEKEIFSQLGLLTFDDEEGRTYPLSESGKQVVSLFLHALKKSNVEIRTSTEVLDIKKEGNGVKICLQDEELFFDACILALGGFSYRYLVEEKRKFYDKLAIPLTPCSPSLTPLYTSSYRNKNLEGKRYSVILRLFYKEQCIFKENGEILFKKDGISGIVTFNASAKLARLHLYNFDGYRVHIDFAPRYNEEELKKIVFHPDFSLEENLERMVGKELAEEWMWHIKKGNSPLQVIKDFSLDIKGLYPLEHSQVTSGGIDFHCLNEDGALYTLPQIYPCGEMLDIDGDSGGYNIAFAFASAYFVVQKMVKK